MNPQPEADTPTPEGLARIEETVRCRLVGRVRDFRLIIRDRGLVLRGQALSYYVKQLAQHAVMQTTRLPIRANDIEVSGAERDAAQQIQKPIAAAR
jgi:hypothetical protein